MIDRNAKELQRGAFTAFCSAAGGVQTPLAGATEVEDGSLSLIVGHSKCDEKAKSVSLSAHFANCEEQRSRVRAAYDSGGAPMGNTLRSFASVFPGSTEPRDFSDRC